METCPNCGSNKVMKMGKGVMALVVACGGSFVFFVLGFLFPLFWAGIPASWVLAGLTLLGSSVYQCQACKNSWPVTKKKSVSA